MTPKRRAFVEPARTSDRPEEAALGMGPGAQLVFALEGPGLAVEFRVTPGRNWNLPPALALFDRAAPEVRATRMYADGSAWSLRVLRAGKPPVSLDPARADALFGRLVAEGDRAVWEVLGAEYRGFAPDARAE
jgi:hypothetical protein